MKRTSILIMTIAFPLMLLAQGWPANYGGVMLQGFYWDSYSETTWNQLTKQADELSQYFDLIWVPNSGQTKADKWNAPGNWGYENMGYSPVYWLRHNTCFGTEKELKTMIQTFKEKGTGIIEDVVINHKNGLSNWADFPNESVTTASGKTYTVSWCTDMTNLWGICSNDEVFGNSGIHDGVQYTCGKANADEGDNFDGCRDLDHTNATVQQNIKTYLSYLTEELGYAGFRYDMVKGYAAYYVGKYNESVGATFSVGEYWAGTDEVKKWIQDTKTYGGYQSAAFDFGLKFVINEAFGNGNWGALSSKGNAADTDINRYAVTFVDNHDTYRDANKLENNVLAANAFILAMPGTPCLFWKHWTAYKEPLKKMIEARKEAGINNQSPIVEQYYKDGGYVTVVQGTKRKVLVISGYPQGVDLTGYTCVVSGDSENPNFAYYISDDEVEQPSEEGITVYVRANSSDYYLYAWDSNHEYFTPWPGEKLSTLPIKQIDGKTWYYRNFDSASLNIILNEGSGNSQTGDITGITADYFIDYNGGTTAENLTIDYTYDKAIDEESVYAYFEKPAEWGSPIKVWAWNGATNYTGGTWPGENAVKVGNATNGNEIWRWVCTTEGTPANIIFNDGSNQTRDLAFTNGGYYTADGLQRTVSNYAARLGELFGREFKADVRCTICLPFDISADDMSLLDGQAYEMTGYADGLLKFQQVSAIEAFKPYMFVANTAGKLLTPFSHNTYADGQAIAVTKDGYTFEGATTTKQLVSNAATTYYGYKTTDNSFVKVGSDTGAKVSAWRAYFYSSAANAAPVGTTFESLTDGIGNAHADIPAAMQAEATIYDLQGRPVGKRTGNLQKGIYIIGNKKVVVR